MTKEIQKSNSFGVSYWQRIMPTVVGSNVNLECCQRPHHRRELAFWRIDLDQALLYGSLAIVKSKSVQMSLF